MVASERAEGARIVTCVEAAACAWCPFRFPVACRVRWVRWHSCVRRIQRGVCAGGARFRAASGARAACEG